MLKKRISRRASKRILKKPLQKIAGVVSNNANRWLEEVIAYDTKDQEFNRYFYKYLFPDNRQRVSNKQKG